jgi:hypothetical protein
MSANYSGFSCPEDIRFKAAIATTCDFDRVYDVHVFIPHFCNIKED